MTFPLTALPQDLQIEVFSHFRIVELIKMSRLNKKFHLLLSNDPYFKELFFKQHPSLKDVHEKLFKDSRVFLPTNYWKVACHILSDESYKAEHIFLKVLDLPITFFNQAAPALKKELENCQTESTEKVKQQKNVEKYHSSLLEKKLVFIEERLKIIVKTLNILETDPKKIIARYKLLFASIFSNAKSYETAIKKTTILNEILKLINQTSVQNPLPENELEKIKILINSYPKSHLIWESLQYACAKDSIENDWAQQHFPRFLPKLTEILTDTKISEEILISELKEDRKGNIANELIANYASYEKNEELMMNITGI